MRKCSSIVSHDQSINNTSAFVSPRKTKSINHGSLQKEKFYKYSKAEYKKEATKFLSGIALKTPEEMALEAKTSTNKQNVIKKINIQSNPMKIGDHLNELLNYSKEQMMADAVFYLTNLGKFEVDKSLLLHKNKKISQEKFLEVEECDGLKLIKLDSLKHSYYFHLELKTNYNFPPLISGYEPNEESIEFSENDIILMRNCSKESNNKGTETNVKKKELKILKHQMFKICEKMELDLYIASVAWIYFEYLFKKGIVGKKNKNLIICIVFILALKFYDIDDKKYVDAFYEIISKVFKGEIKKKDILDNEIKIYGNLNFCLSVPIEAVDFHLESYRRIKEKYKAGSDRNEYISYN